MKKTNNKQFIMKNPKNILLTGCCSLMVMAFTAKAQIITTVAGEGTQSGYTGDAGQATAAKLSAPNCVAFDDSGNYYIDDETNNVIRKVDITTGVITTVAGNGSAGYFGDGGAATSAKLNWPIGVVLDATGNMYIGDFHNNVVRKVTKSTGKISTVAGTHVCFGSNSHSNISGRSRAYCTNYKRKGNNRA